MKQLTPLKGWAFCGKIQFIMSFIKSIFNKASKKLSIEEFVDSEIDAPVSIELKAGSGKIVKVLFFEQQKEILVSQDVALILINQNKAALCQ
jgi:hypothetical protein